MRCIFTSLAMLLLLLPLKGQEAINIAANFHHQLLMSPQEKVFLMTDKAIYIAGEHIWFRAFLTDALSHRLDIPQSRYVYVELINPAGTICKRLMIRPDTQGVFHNRIELSDDLAEGTYLIRAYTAYMRSQPDYIFEKRVFIADPQSRMIGVEHEFAFSHDSNVSIQFRFRDLRDSTFLPIEVIKMSVGEGEFKEFSAKKSILFNANREKDKYLYLTFTYNSRKYQKFIPIPYPNNSSFVVSFFPEGGSLINNVFSKIGFKALRSDGLSTEITGAIYDSDNQHIISFESLHAGMGSFLLMPEVGKTYYSLCVNEEGISMRFDLPTAKANVHALKVIQRNEQFIINTHNNCTIPASDLFLLIHVRGMVYYSDKLPPNGIIALQADDLPSGIIQILLLDKEMHPLSERLVFNRLQDFAMAKLVPDRPKYGRRTPVKVAIKLDVPKGYDNNGSFAVSVTDDSDLLPDSTMTLASYLLLSSELKGYIEDANYYLSDDPKAKDALDALMLTQGWRRYDVPAIVKGNLTETESYVEEGQEFFGYVKEVLLGRPAQEVSVFIMAPDMEYIQEVQTDKSGIFYASGFEFPDSTRYTIFASAPRGRSVELKLEPELSPLPAQPVGVRGEVAYAPFNDYVAKVGKRYVDEYGIRSYELNEVVVSASKKEFGKSVYSSDLGGGRVVQQQIIESNQFDIVRILKQSSDINVVEKNNSVLIYLRPIISTPQPSDASKTGATSTNTVEFVTEPVLIVVDDINMGKEFQISSLIGIPIARIEVLRPPTSIIFGPNGTFGVLLITTGQRGAATHKPLPYSVSVVPLGYKGAVEFYSPVYETDTQRYSSKPDLRTTIYWKPDIQITDGVANIEFYTSDAYSTYSMVLEGITADGLVVRQVGKIKVL